MKLLVNGQQVEAEMLQFETPVERFVEYRLSNGNILRVKFIVATVYKTPLKNPDGTDLYVMNGQAIFNVEDNNEVNSTAKPN